MHHTGDLFLMFSLGVPHGYPNDLLVWELPGAFYIVFVRPNIVA